MFSTDGPTTLQQLTLWNCCSLVFPVTFLLAIPLHFAFRSLKNWVSQNWLLAWVNHVFVKDYGYLIFTLLYFGYLFTYQRNNRLPYDMTVRFFFRYGVNSVTCVIVNIWFFGPSIFERINVATGGYCEGTGQTAHSCRQSGGQWIDGFDCSGHYYLISSISLMLVAVILERVKSTRAEESFHSSAATPESTQSVSAEPGFSMNLDVRGILDDSRNPDLARMYNKTLLVFSAFVLSMWFWMFLVTSIFFHTLEEKAAGLTVGLVVPITLNWFDSAY